MIRWRCPASCATRSRAPRELAGYRGAPGARQRTSAAIEAICERRRDEIVARIDATDDAIDALRAGSLDESARTAAHRAGHQLAGSAGTFGFTHASELARELEHALDLTAPSGVDSAPRLAELAIALGARTVRQMCSSASEDVVRKRRRARRPRVFGRRLHDHPQGRPCREWKVCQ